MEGRRQAGVLPMFCPPIGKGSVINMVVTGSLQHIVFPLNPRGGTTTRFSSPLQTVNLLVYSFPKFTGIYHLLSHWSPLCVNAEARKQKDQISMLTRRVSHRSRGYNRRVYKVSQSLFRTGPSGLQRNCRAGTHPGKIL